MHGNYFYNNMQEQFNFHVQDNFMANKILPVPHFSFKGRQTVPDERILFKTFTILRITIKPALDRTHKTFATSEDSDQPAHPCSLIRLRWSLCLLLPPRYPKRNEKEALQYWWMYRLIWVFAGHTGLIVDFYKIHTVTTIGVALNTQITHLRNMRKKIIYNNVIYIKYFASSQ